MKNGAIWEYETYCLDGVSRVSFELPTHDLSILVKSDLWQKLLDFLGCAQSEDLRMSQQEKTALLEALLNNKECAQQPRSIFGIFRHNKISDAIKE